MAQFRAKDDKVQGQQLKVQELTVRTADTQLYVVDGGGVVLLIKEPVAAVVSCLMQDDSAGTLAPVAAANLSIVDKDSPYGAGGDLSAIRVASTVLAANDVLHVKYITVS